MAALRYYFYILCGVYLLEVGSAFLFALPRKLFRKLGEHTIKRALLLLEDWKPGHYLEVDGKPYVNWKAGDTVEWLYSTPHMAANIGLEDRYTLQITGHL